MSDHAQAEAVVARVTARLREARTASGAPLSPERMAFTADLALRLARAGHVLAVQFTLHEGVEHVEALEQALLALNAEDAPGSTIAPEGDPTPVRTRERMRASVHMRFPCVRATCEGCGAGFEVDYRHPKAHRFCSASLDYS
jgi:hypothetical protein